MAVSTALLMVTPETFVLYRPGSGDLSGGETFAAAISRTYAVGCKSAYVIEGTVIQPEQLLREVVAFNTDHFIRGCRVGIVVL